MNRDGDKVQRAAIPSQSHIIEEPSHMKRLADSAVDWQRPSRFKC